MTAKQNGETKRPEKSSPWLRALGNFYNDAYVKIKLLFSRSKPTSSNVNTGNTVNIQYPVKEEQKNIACNSSPYLLILPPDIRNRFIRLAHSRREVNAALMNHAANHSTLALLNINNIYFWGVNNYEAALTPRDLNDIRIILKDEKNFSSYSAILGHAEANAILKAFKQKMTSDRATMFIDREQCNVCGRKEFNETYLRRLLPILSLKELTVYTTNSMGVITKLVLSPPLTGTSHQNFW